MNQKIFNNILLLLIILALIRHISPEPTSVLFVIKKYLNFLIFKIKRFFLTLLNYDYENFKMTEMRGRTFNGLQNFEDKAPNFISSHQIYWVEDLIKHNPLIKPEIAKKLYYFIETLVTIDTDDYFISGNDNTRSKFTDNEIQTIINILMNKLNSSDFKFTQLQINNNPYYYVNPNGKDVDPFIFSILCDKDIGLLKIYIELSIRSDIQRNKDIIAIKKIRLLASDKPNKLKQPNKPEQNTIKGILKNTTFVNNEEPKKNIPKINDETKFNWSNYENKDNYKINYSDSEIPNYNENNELYSDYDNIIQNQEIIINQNNTELNYSDEQSNLFSKNHPIYSDEQQMYSDERSNLFSDNHPIYSDEQPMYSDEANNYSNKITISQLPNQSQYSLGSSIINFRKPETSNIIPQAENSFDN